MTISNRFITAGFEMNTFEKHVPAPYFRKEFTSEKETITLTIAVCGFYELFLDGEKITKGRLAPYISNTDHLVYADKYEVSLEKGTHTVGVLLGNGFQNNQGGHEWDFDKATFRSAPKFSIIAESENGVIFDSSSGFKTHPSPILYDDYRIGEIYDANKELCGWNKTGFDDSAWTFALNAPSPKGELRLCEADPILVEKEVSAISVEKSKNGYLYTFPTNRAGVCKLKVKNTKAGQKITFRHSDKLRENGDVEYYLGLWFPKHTNREEMYLVHRDTYICVGAEEETYTPTFTYHSFKYVEVDGIDESQATPDLLTFEVMNSALQECADFISSSEDLNKVQRMARNSTLSNFHYFPTDCPHREKQGWTGDACLSSEQTILNLRAEKSYREWLRSICASQNGAGAIPAIVPTGGWGFAWGTGPAWDAALFFIPYYCYKYRGDVQIIKECAPTFIKYLNYLTTRIRPDGLIAWGLIDWVQTGYFPSTQCPLEVSDTIMSYANATKAAEMFDVIGMKHQAEFARSIASDLKEAFHKNLVDENKVVKGDCESSQAMALYYGLFDECDYEKASDELIRIVHREGDALSVGGLGLRTIFHELSRKGENDLAIKLCINRDSYSYATFIDDGSDTLYERFDLKEVSNSHNHHFYSDVSAFFISDIAGIKYNPTFTDLTRVDICPGLVSTLDSAKSHFDSNFGKIVSSWKKDGEDYVLSVEMPDTLHGEIRTPKGFVFEDGKTVLDAKTGEYRIKKV